jgi:hypothetical protein
MYNSKHKIMKYKMKNLWELLGFRNYVKYPSFLDATLL